jgi:preprotein translocase subunit YajC
MVSRWTRLFGHTPWTAGHRTLICSINKHRDRRRSSALHQISSLEEPSLITPAFAQGVSGLPATDTLIQFVPFVLIFVIMWFLIIRPQQRRAREHADMIKAVRRGDTVITSGGFIGRVTKVIDDAEIEVELAPETRVRLVRAMIAEVRAKGEPVKD